MATTMLWAYLAFSQFLIIWSGNTQEEAPWYMDRMGEGWILVSLILIVFHFALPFTALLTRRTKRAKNVLEFLQQQGLEPYRVRMSVAGRFEPSQVKEARKNPALHERVEVFLLDELVSEPAAP